MTVAFLFFKLGEGVYIMAKFQRKSFEEKKKEVETLTKNMEENIERYFESPEQLAEYLAFKAKFYKYSPSNAALIEGQFPGAEAVGSYKFWKDKGFPVQKGEKGIKILVPNRTKPKFKDEEGKMKPLEKASSKERKMIEEGKIKVEQGRLYFSVGHVFDVSQTSATAKDLPDIFPNRWLEGNVEDYFLLYKGMEKIAESNGIKIIEPKEELGAAKGVSYTLTKEVALNPRNSELQNVKTLLHELAHAKLHTVETHENYTAPEKEFQAEMTAYTVANYFGIDTSEYSLNYLHHWTEDRELREKTQLLKEVHETSIEFIDTIEETVGQERERTKGQENESPELLVVQFGALSSTAEQHMTVESLRKMIDKQDSSFTKIEHENLDDKAFIEAFNQSQDKKAVAIPESAVTSPAVLIQWSESEGLKSGELIPFGEANEKMKHLSMAAEKEAYYEKTRYHIILPKELNDKNQLSVINMDRLDLGDGFYKSPLEQIMSEKNLPDNVLSVLKEEAKNAETGKEVSALEKNPLKKEASDHQKAKTKKEKKQELALEM